MIARRAKGRDRLPQEELSPKLHDAVQRLLDDRVPDALTRRLVRSLHRQVAYYPRKSRSRLRSLSMSLAVASVASVALTILLWTAQSIGHAAGWLWLEPAPGAEIAVLSDDSPTAWAYSKAARKSPEALYALMDRQSRPSLSAASQWLAGTNPSFTSSQAMP